MLYGTQVALPIDPSFPASPTSLATSHVESMKKLVQEARATMAKA